MCVAPHVFDILRVLAPDVQLKSKSASTEKRAVVHFIKADGETEMKSHILRVISRTTINPVNPSG